MFKTSEEIIVIQAEATTDIPTGVVFWSHDKGTAKMLFQLQKDYVNQTLSEGTIVPICLDFVGGRHIYHAVIEDAINGIVSIVLEDNILGYVGRVTGSIYIELPDSRSLDTAGRFTFDIKRSPIDLNTPELEDYYWQGFNEIIDEYHQTINTIESEAKALIDSLTADVTAAQNKVTQLEQSITTANTNLNTRIDEINKKIDDNDVFTKAKSSANVIYQIIGREKVRMNITLDFKDKIRGSIEKNLNFLSHTANLDLSKKPDNYTYESEQYRYDKISILDGASDKLSTVEANNIPGYVATYPILDTLKRLLGEQFFIDRGANDIASELLVVKNLVKKLGYTVNGFGTSDGIGKLTCQLFTQTGGGRWFYSKTSNSITTAEIRNDVSQEDVSIYLDSNGRAYLRAYADISGENAVSTVSIDYMKLDFEIEISVNDHIKSLIAANHVENLATQAEAEAGEDNTKTMTPLRVFQSIAQWTKNKFISLTENETVLGIKNFANGLQVGGNNVLSQNGEIRFVTNSTNNSSLESGSIVFKRYGDDVDIYANFQVRASGDLTRDMNIVAESIVDDIFEPGENFSFFVGSETAQAVVKFVGKGIKAHSTLTKGIWYVGTASYKAKNKL